MKTNPNRLHSLIHNVLQATKATFILLALTTVQDLYGQCSPANSNPVTENHCRTSLNGSMNQTPATLLGTLGGNVSNGFANIGDKNQSMKRSIFLNGKINNTGGFAVIQSINLNPSNPDVYFANHNQEGSVFATDVDNDCNYEGEDNLLNWLANNGFDEINLYNIDHILQNANRELVSVTQQEIDNHYNNQQDEQGWEPTTDNLMQEHEKTEFHLLRFIHKAKVQYGLEVNFILSGKKDLADSEEFYVYNLNGGGEDPQYPLNEYYCDMYRDVAFPGMFKTSSGSDPEPLQYILYEEAEILVNPRDSLGRISFLDKALIDLYNMHVFNIRVENQLISPSSQSCTGTINVSNCSGTCDAILFEYEWWDNTAGTEAPDDPTFYPDAELLELKELVRFSKCFPNNMYASCEPKVYGTADYFKRTQSNHNWVNNTLSEQQRANYVDDMFDRIYLYSYHKNPCDCYNGLGTSTTETDFNHKVALFNNNNFGGIINPSNSIRSTEIYPVFHAEYHETDMNEVFHYTHPRDYAFDNTNTIQYIGCGNSSGKCDYCSDYSGRFFNDLGTYINNQNSSYTVSAGKRLGFVENIFQSQYDLDPATSAPVNFGQNQVNGYCWFKSGTLYKNQISNKNATTGINSISNQVLKIYPNPAQQILYVDYDASKVSKMMIYDISGKVVFQQYTLNQKVNLNHIESGVYFLSIIEVDGNVLTQKFVKE